MQVAAGEAGRDEFEAIERILMHVSWLCQRQFMQLLASERFDLTVPQFITLLHLDWLGATCTMSGLAEATQQSAASLTGVVDRLLHKQLAQRVRAESDRRQVLVQATAQGKALLAEVRAARRQQLRAALSTLDGHETGQLLELLGRVAHGLQHEIDREHEQHL